MSNTAKPRPDQGRTARRPSRGPEGAPDALSRIPCPILRSAAASVFASRPQLSDVAGAGELWDELVSLTLAVHRSQRVGRARVATDSPRQRQLLDLLRSEVLQNWSKKNGAASDPASLLDLLVAVERVRQALQPNGDQCSTALLSGPDGSSILAEIAHDLRSPLTAILTLAETLRRGQSGTVNDIQRRQLGLVYSAALALSSTASDLIELAQGGEGGDRLSEKEPSPFSVSEIFESVRDIVQPMAEEKGLAVRLLPPANDQRLGYPSPLSRVLLNLTTNGLKFTDAGFVEISARTTGLTSVEFAVRDTGHGIDPHARANLYQPFRRTSVRRGYVFSGTGLGLAICRKLVKAMGGELRLETNSAWGTRFYFTLQLPRVDDLQGAREGAD